MKEFISPLLQPPLNRLFIPRVTPDCLPSLDGDTEKRQWARVVVPTAHYVRLLSAASAQKGDGSDGGGDGQPPPKATLGRRERVLAQKIVHREAIEEQLVECIPTNRHGSWLFHPFPVGDPSKNPPEQMTKDPYKTLFVARLPYDLEEARLRREFERFGPVRTVSLGGNVTHPYGPDQLGGGRLK